MQTIGRRSIVLALAAIPLGAYIYTWATYPSDRTPKGAYLRVVRAVNETDPAAFFAYIEEAAQHACYSIRDYRKKGLQIIRNDFPPEKRSDLEQSYEKFATAPDGADVFARLAKEYGWLDQLRKDMSAVASVEVVGPRATVETVKGTRYAFRRRPNGIWGLTAFTPTLVEESEKAARDYKLLLKAAEDYRRVERNGN